MYTVQGKLYVLSVDTLCRNPIDIPTFFLLHCVRLRRISCNISSRVAVPFLGVCRSGKKTQTIQWKINNVMGITIMSVTRRIH